MISKLLEVAQLSLSATFIVFDLIDHFAVTRRCHRNGPWSATGLDRFGKSIL